MTSGDGDVNPPSESWKGDPKGEGDVSSTITEKGSLGPSFLRRPSSYVCCPLESRKPEEGSGNPRTTPKVRLLKTVVDLTPSRASVATRGSRVYVPGAHPTLVMPTSSPDDPGDRWNRDDFSDRDDGTVGPVPAPRQKG